MINKQAIPNNVVYFLLLQSDTVTTAQHVFLSPPTSDRKKTKILVVASPTTMWLTAIGRAAARRGLLSSRTATRNFGARPALASVRRIDASQYLSLRSLSISAATRSPAKSSTGSKTTKKTKSAAPKKKKKAVAKKKPAKKPALKKAKKPKKAVTPEEKEKSELRQLRKMALLKGPQLLPESAWSVYMSDNMRAGQGSLSDKVKELSQSFANVSASEKDVS